MNGVEWTRGGASDLDSNGLGPGPLSTVEGPRAVPRSQQLRKLTEWLKHLNGSVSPEFLRTEDRSRSLVGPSYSHE